MHLIGLHFVYGVLFMYLGVWFGQITEKKKSLIHRKKLHEFYNKMIRDLEQRYYFSILETFSCMVCGRVKLFKDIGVITHDLSQFHDMPEGAFKINVRYCNERGCCVFEAHDIENWKDGNVRMKNPPKD